VDDRTCNVAPKKALEDFLINVARLDREQIKRFIGALERRNDILEGPLWCARCGEFVPVAAPPVCSS
jgi:hypothetical protein